MATTMKTFTQRGAAAITSRSESLIIALCAVVKVCASSQLLRYTLYTVSQERLAFVIAYSWRMPKLWNDTIAAHRSEVRDAILEATVTLVGERGLSSVTMSQIAKASGIGRATLYKYFADVQAILVVWHERQVGRHLAQLVEARDQAGDAAERLEVVLETFAMISHEHHATELAAVLHRGDHVVRAHQHLSALVRDLIAEGARMRVLREDVAPAELATYCLHALSAASSLPSKAAVKRLVTVTLAGLRPSKR